MRNDSRLNCIRALAVVMIVFCHYFQIIGVLQAALWLNTGVQVFFVLSAYLMSQKKFVTMDDVLQFYKKRVLRLMLPMWLYTLCLVLVLLVLHVPVEPQALLFYAIGGAGFAPSGILGLGHFWYITVILICYLLVPLLDRITCKKHPWLLSVLLSALAIAVMTWAGKSAYGVNIALFMLSYLLFRQNEDGKLAGWNMVALLVATVLFNALRILLDGYAFSKSVIQLYDGIFVTASKCLLGLSLFLLLMKVLKNEDNGRFTQYLSKRSYEIYLVHQFILLAVDKYIPFPGKGSALGTGLMLLVSVILIWCNTEALALLAGFFRKTKVKS